MTIPRLSLPADPDVVKCFPHAIVQSGTITIPHDAHATVVLNRLGFDVGSSLTNYNWPSQRAPFDVQVRTVDMLIHNPRSYVLSSMGVGKTSCPLWAFDLLKQQGLANKMLVVCPLSTMNFVWLREAFICTPHLRVCVLYGSKAKRIEKLKTDADIYIINHDGVGTILKELTARTDIDVVCLDELAVYRNNTDRSKNMKAFARSKAWVWGMTGAPTPNAPTDVFHQAQIITPHTVPKYYTRFRDELMLKVSAFKFVPKKDATQKAFDALQPSVRFVLEDVTELPPYVSRRLDVDMGPKQKKVYEEIRKHAYSLVGSHKITAANAGAVLVKLLQISCGWVYSKTKGVIALDNDERIQALVDLINSSSSKLIVFTTFKSSLRGICDALKVEGIDAAPPVSGDTPSKDRDRIFYAFQNSPQYKVLPAHPQCVSHGITLTAADTMVWFNPTTSLEIYDQAVARIRRVGQKSKQQYIHMQSTPVEKRIYDLLINKGNIQSELLTMFEK